MNALHDALRQGNFRHQAAGGDETFLEMLVGLVLGAASGAGLEMSLALAGQLGRQQPFQASDQLVATFSAVHVVAFG